MDVDRRQILVGTVGSALIGAVGGGGVGPSLVEPEVLGTEGWHPLTRLLLERARRSRRGRGVPDRAMVERAIRQYAEGSGWTKPLVIKWMDTPTEAHVHLSRFGRDTLLDMGSTSFWRLAQPRVSLDADAFDRALDVRMLANEILGVGEHDRHLMAPKLLAKAKAVSANLSAEDVFRVRAVSAQIGWLETSMADAAAQAISTVEGLLRVGEPERTLSIDNQLTVVEAWERGLLATWETPDAVICVPRRTQI